MPDSRKASKSRAKPKAQADRRKTTSTRISPELRAHLDDEAKHSHRSLAQEIELRLEASRRQDQGRLNDFVDEMTLKAMRSLALAKILAEGSTGGDAFTDAKTAELAHRASLSILDVIYSARPGGPEDKTTPTKGQESIISDPMARVPPENIRDAILEGLLPQMPEIRAVFEKKAKG